MTWIRDEQAAPEVLKAAAKAMRHKLETADSDRYECVRAPKLHPDKPAISRAVCGRSKATHDRLTAAATQARAVVPTQ